MVEDWVELHYGWCSSLVYSVLYVNYDTAPIRSNKIFSRENTSQPITQNDHFKKFVCRKHTDMNLLFNMEYGKNHNEVALKKFFIIMFSPEKSWCVKMFLSIAGVWWLLELSNDPSTWQISWTFWISLRDHFFLSTSGMKTVNYEERYLKNASILLSL